MCTLSVVPTKPGYLIAMNRDELLTRERAFPPKLRRAGGLWTAYPRESEGGTWIGCNERGITLALLNWNLPSAPHKLRSRGSIIPQLIGCPDLSDVERAVQAWNFSGIFPFRLVGIFGPQGQVREWRWDGASLKRQVFPWQSRHWFSSGLSDELAEKFRSEICRNAWSAADSGTPAWLRQLHRSHGAAPGPFSMCVHRPDAATVSYSEIACQPSELTFRYVDGAPCKSGPATVLTVPMATHPEIVVA